MASKSISFSLARNVTARGYASACPAVVKSVAVSQSATPKKTILVALDNKIPVLRLTVAFKAGHRYEPACDPGLVHVLRSAAGLTTESASSFIIARNLQQIGASVTTTTDRELIYYTLEAAQYNYETAIKYFAFLIGNQEFRPWELNDNIPRLKYDLAVIPPQVKAIDLMHKAAFRRGLGNSLFIAPHAVGNICTESLLCFRNNHLTFDRCAIVGVGLQMEQVKCFSQYLCLNDSGKGVSEPPAYTANTLCENTGGCFTHMAIGGVGARSGTKEALALAVAAKAFGNGPVAKWGNDYSVLGRALCNVVPYAAAGFNLSYADVGLFGVILTVPKDEARNAAMTVKAALSNCCLSKEAINAGKNKLLVDLYSEGDMHTSLSESLALEALTQGKSTHPHKIADEVIKLTDNDVNAALSCVARCNLVMGAVGNTEQVPYIDEI